MSKKLITQIDTRWRMTPRYDDLAVDTLDELDLAIVDCLDEPTDKNKTIVLKAQHQFNHAVQRLIDEGILLRRKGNYSVEDYGCWDCCMCMVAHDLNIRLYRNNHRNGLIPTPPNFIEALRSWQIMSFIGYTFDLVIDPMTLVTKNKVQLFMHEDYGINGISPRESALLSYALRYRQHVCIVACVKGHASYGDKDSTHWVMIDVQEDSQTLMMRDPSKNKRTKFNYRKLYTLCLYASPKSMQSLLRAYQ
tara:strand:- start:625 stop:1371 length:747 start_codon:yes stop_codon:yes gene_type:complete